MPTPATPPELLRPAIIEIRYIDKPHFDNAVALYSQKLRLRSGRLMSNSDTACVFRVGLLDTPDRKDIQLRLTYPLKAPPPDKNGETYVYWHIEGDSPDALREAYTQLDATATQQVEPPATYFYDADPLPTTLVPARSLLKLSNADGSTGPGGYLGLTINPPVPTLTKEGDEGYLRQQSGLTSLLRLFGWALLALLGGIGMYQWGKNAGIKKGRAMAG